MSFISDSVTTSPRNTAPTPGHAVNFPELSNEAARVAAFREALRNRDSVSPEILQWVTKQRDDTRETKQIMNKQV